MKNRKEERISTLYVVLASLLFSLGGLLVKLIPWGALAINGARNLIGVFVVGGYLLLSRHKLRFSKPVLVGAASMVGVTTFYTIANKLTTAANAIVLQFTAPVFVILILWIFFRKRPTRLDVTACCVVFFGVALFFVDSLKAGNMLGNLVAVLSGLCYAGVFLMNSSEKSDAISSVFLGQLFSSVLFAPFCFGEERLEPTALGALLALGVLQLGLAYIFLSKGIKHTPPVTASLITRLEPVLNPLLVAVFYREQVSALAYVGAAIVIGAIVGYNLLKARQTARENSC